MFVFKEEGGKASFPVCPYKVYDEQKGTLYGSCFSFWIYLFVFCNCCLLKRHSHAAVSENHSIASQFGDLCGVYMLSPCTRLLRVFWCPPE